MKFLKTFEIHRKDRQLIMSINKKFTVAFEFELECDDPKIMENISDAASTNMFRQKLIEEIRDSIDIVEYAEFIDDMVNGIDLLDDDEDEILRKFKPKKITNKLTEQEKNYQTIINTLHYILLDYFENYEEPEIGDDDTEYIDNVEYLKKKVEDNFPKFYEKYNDVIKFNLDSSLRKGIEFSLKTYLYGLDDGIEMLNMFFDEYGKQSYFFMNENTSIHINLGLNSDVKYNVLKGVIMLADFSKNDIPYVFKDMTWRMNNQFCRSIIPELNKLNIDWSKIDLSNLEQTEKFLITKIKHIFKVFGAKSFGLNLKRLFENNYLEFRYAGGKLNLEVMKDKLVYFSYILHIMTTDYKEKEYHKKLYKFIDEKRKQN
jgi:hypothetical protein